MGSTQGRPLQMHTGNFSAQTDPEVNKMREEEKKPLSWEVADPKLPVIRSGHMENRKK